MSKIETTEIIVHNQEHLGGSPRFAGTRIPFGVIFGYLTGVAKTGGTEEDAREHLKEDYPGLEGENLEFALKVFGWIKQTTKDE